MSKLEQKIEQLFLERIYLIDQINHFGVGNTDDERPAFILLGTPDELIKALTAVASEGTNDERTTTS